MHMDVGEGGNQDLPGDIYDDGSLGSGLSGTERHDPAVPDQDVPGLPARSRDYFPALEQDDVFSHASKKKDNLDRLPK